MASDEMIVNTTLGARRLSELSGIPWDKELGQPRMFAYAKDADGSKRTTPKRRARLIYEVEALEAEALRLPEEALSDVP